MFASVANHFNPRSLAGATPIMGDAMLEGNISNHAPSRERQNAVQGQTVDFLFQSTLPRGSDKGADFLCLKVQISIHAPSRERRRRSVGAGAGGAISIHAPSRERHYFGLPTGVPNLISIHAPSRERRTTSSINFIVTLFQSTLPRGSDV